MKEALIRLPHARVTWICALFLLGYVGIEVALGGWIVKWSVTYLLYTRQRHANALQYVPPDDLQQENLAQSAQAPHTAETVNTLHVPLLTHSSHARSAQRRRVRQRHDSHRVLDGHNRRPHHTRLRDATSGREARHICTSMLMQCTNPPRPPRAIHPQTNLPADLPPADHGLGADLLAGPTILRLGRGCLAAGLLTRPAVPRGHCRSDQAAPATPACQRHRICGSVWRIRRGDFPLCRGCHCTGQGRAGVAARRVGTAGRYLGTVVVSTKDPPEGGVSNRDGCEDRIESLRVCRNRTDLHLYVLQQRSQDC
jgi:hypothetical protein